MFSDKPFQILIVIRIQPFSLKYYDLFYFFLFIFSDSSLDRTQKSNIKTFKTVSDYLDQANEQLTDRFENLKAFMIALGDDVQMKTLKYNIAFKRIKNFACVEVHPQSNSILVYFKVDPTTVTLEQGFTRNVTNIGHYGTGDLEIRINNDEDLEKAKHFIEKSYDIS
ncbi:putative transport protein [Lysinibacillus sp. RC46]|uniref:DUF5655 domain-containing protein n=1 Tax=Lysinibacillus sp. RC46 TaxID=3156295 RepID=UPI003512AB60